MANWIAKATSKHKGALTATAKREGAVHDGIDKGWLARKAKGSGTTARRARLAQTLGRLRGRKT